MKHWREGRRQQVEARRKKTILFALCDGNEGGVLVAGGPSLLWPGKGQRLLNFSQRHKGAFG